MREKSGGKERNKETKKSRVEKKQVGGGGVVKKTSLPSVY